MRWTHHTRSMEAKQSDNGIGDTLVLALEALGNDRRRYQGPDCGTADEGSDNLRNLIRGRVEPEFTTVDKVHLRILHMAAMRLSGSGGG